LSLPDEYQRQFDWRPWPHLFAALPAVAGKTILDLGCGVGQQAAELVARGARVIGVDSSDELLATARKRVPSGLFLKANLTTLALERTVDGIWSSFVPAYFPELLPVLALWRAHLAPGGWIALTEIDDLFGHEPVAARTASLLEGFTATTLARGSYDFHMGRKLYDLLQSAGFSVRRELVLEDQELAFQGAATPEVLDAWRARFARMPALQQYCGERFAALRDDFLACLARADHRSSARVFCCVAER
jgi:trans-aconitate methyltransferase